MFSLTITNPIPLPTLTLTKTSISFPTKVWAFSISLSTSKSPGASNNSPMIRRRRGKTASLPGTPNMRDITMNQRNRVTKKLAPFISSIPQYLISLGTGTSSRTSLMISSAIPLSSEYSGFRTIL
ncbi:124aa long hypothetical protein [Pyrococcus horikoshii OT3]|uniref:Uncharacterized protein n=1 Tax=Pyrococcus horikoshii (strain ATCC 700860 / DSM 12428 / JCM 9974 / NBRC 100139 / OT-3) TaxID=70601 RepID=O58068_PYRHO|nr:124aa long hypothetical protein [Pyrococcus horikoshii OT3]